MNQVTYCELSSDDLDRAVKFYRDVFGWKVKKWVGPVEYFMLTAASDMEPGINGGTGARRGPSDRTANAIGVVSLAATEAKIEAHGGKVLEARRPVPGVGWFAVCADSEGNTFSLLQQDGEAK